MRSILLATGMAIDSGFMSAGLAPMMRSGGSRLVLSYIFGVCDAIALLIGAAFGPSLSIAGYGPVMLAIYAACVAAFSATASRWPAWMLIPVPIALSLDNLAVGAAVDGILDTVPLALVSLATTSILSLVGFYVGNRLFRDGNWLVAAAALSACAMLGVLA